MPFKSSPVAGLFCAVFLLSACGGGLSALEGTWTERDAEGSAVVLEITGDGEATFKVEGMACTGELEPVDDDVYKTTLDCGFSKMSVTFAPGSEEDTLIVDDGSGGEDPSTLVRMGS